jgi:hypothetical protein
MDIPDEALDWLLQRWGCVHDHYIYWDTKRPV